MSTDLFPVLAESPLLGVGSQRKEEFSGPDTCRPTAEIGLASCRPTQLVRVLHLNEREEGCKAGLSGSFL